MRKKENSLLDKLKQENQANSTSSNALSNIEHLFSEISNNTKLTDKIKEVKRLQNENRLESSKKIFEIMNNEFQYSYPFYFEFTHIVEIKIRSRDLILKDTLENHIVREFKLLKEVKPLFDRTIKNIKEKNKLVKEGTPKNGLIAGLILGAIGLYLAYSFNIYMIDYPDNHGPVGRMNALLLFFVLIVSFTFYLIFPWIGFLIATFLFTNKSKIRELNKTIAKQTAELKTKANIGYK